MIQLRSVFLFTSPTCAPCSLAKTIVGNFCAKNKIPWVLVDVTEDNITPNRYMVQSVPTVIGVRDGLPCGQITGNVTMDKMEKLFI